MLEGDCTEEAGFTLRLSGSSDFLTLSDVRSGGLSGEVVCFFLAVWLLDCLFPGLGVGFP